MKKKKLLLGMFLFCLLFLLAVPAQAAQKKEGFQEKNQKVYYYNAKGKKLKGLNKIGKKYYYFDKSGVQRTGWQKIGEDYYYFRISSGSHGYMRKSVTVNGVTLQKNGKAVKNTASLRKLGLMIKANQIVEQITKPLMPKSEKLLICFNYTKKTYGYATWRKFRNYSGWEMDYAEDMFVRGKGNCFSYGAAFAFLANAVGYQNVYAVSSGGHGWAEVEGKVYDPDWALVSKVDTYFAMSYSLSGVKGRPNYAPNRAYVAKI